MDKMREKEKFTFDVGWVFLTSIIILVLHFIQKPIMARYLGPDGLGLFSMAIMIVGITQLVTLFGIDGALIKFVAEDKERRERVHSLFSSAFFTALIIGIIASLSLFFFSGVFASIFDMPLLSLLLKIYALAFSFSILNGIIISFFNGLREMKYHALFRVVEASLILVFITTFLVIGLDVKGAMLGQTLAIIVTMVVGMLIVKRFVHFTVSDYRKNIKMLASFGSRLLGANTINQIFNYMDTIMIGYFLTSTDVGYYAVAISLSRFFWLVPRAMATVAYPAVSEYWAKDNHQAINKLVDKSTKYTACILIFVGMAVIFFAKDVITLLFTSEFLPAVLPLTILIIGTVISGILRSIGGTFAGVGKVDLVLKITAIGAAGDVILNIILIPIYGITGAATATAAAYLLNAILIIYFLRKSLAIKFDTPWYAKMAMLIGMSAVLFYSLGSLNYYVSSVVALLFYAIIVVKYLLAKEDLDYFMKIFKQIIHGDFMKV